MLKNVLRKRRERVLSGLIDCVYASILRRENLAAKWVKWKIQLKIVRLIRTVWYSSDVLAGKVSYIAKEKMRENLNIIGIAQQ